MTEEPGLRRKEPFSWRFVVFWRSIGLGAACGAGLGAVLGLVLMFPAGSPLAVPLAAAIGAIIGAAGGLTGGVALVACGPVVRRSRIVASLAAGAGAAAIPLAMTLWIVIRHWPGGSGYVAIAASLIALASGAGLGPLAAAGKTGWSRRRSDGPPASPAHPGGAA